MWKFICAGMSLLVSISAQADTCPLPRPDSGDPYAILAGLPQRELRLLLSEYMFMHRWTMHSEAVAAGFRPGDRVYGEALKPGGKFSAERTAAWRRAYEKSERKQFVDTLGAKVDMATVDRAGRRIGRSEVCLADRVWSQVAVINDCRFAFTAGIVPGDGSSFDSATHSGSRYAEGAAGAGRDALFRSKATGPMRAERRRGGDSRADDGPRRDYTSRLSRRVRSRRCPQSPCKAAGSRNPSPKSSDCHGRVTIACSN